jgi:DNA/RNA endonuclease YhcR with UshA esterase domain
MRIPRFLSALLLTSVTAISPLLAPQKVSANQAKDHIGETATVCSSVVSTRYAASTKGQPTFLNLDKPYPNQIFAVLIWGENRSKFGTPESEYKGKRICVTGKITEYKGAAETAANDPAQIRID